MRELRIAYRELRIAVEALLADAESSNVRFENQELGANSGPWLVRTF